MKIRGTRYVAVASLSTMLLLGGCKKDQPMNEAALAAENPSGLNLLQVPPGTAQPAYGNVGTQVLGASYSAPEDAYGEDYDDYNAMYADLDGTNDPYAEYVDQSVPYATEAPPPLLEYEQPYAPGPDYIWTPGYWSYADTGYYWVPGAWVQPPYVGALWTPGWWGYYGNRYRYHHGYWGRNVGFYGGINFGFGYLGIGYAGGYWNNDHFYYNRAYNRVRPEVVHNYVYDRRANINNRFIDTRRVSYWGGPNGIRRAPVRSELLARAQRVAPPMRSQIENRSFAQRQPQQFYQQNHGRPQMVSAKTGFRADRGIQRPAPIAPAALHQQIQSMQQDRVRWQQQHPNNGHNGPQMQRTDMRQPNSIQRQDFGAHQNMPAQNLTPQQRETLERLHGRGAADNHQVQQQQQRMEQMQQRQQMQVQRQQANVQQQQQRVQQEQQRQQMQQRQQQRQEVQQRQQMNEQRQHANVQRQQIEQRQEQQRQQVQQRQQADQQRQHAEQQRVQENQRAEQQRRQADQQRQQASQRAEQARAEQARAQQAQRQEQQRQQSAQRAQEMQQRQAQQQRAAQQQQRQVQQQQRQVQQQQRQVQHPQAAPRPQAPAGPHGGGNPHAGGGPPQGGGGDHGGGHHDH